MKLSYRDRRAEPALWARELGVSKEAIDLYLASDVIDLHIDSFIWTRVFGYDLCKRHGEGPFRGGFFSQVDFPRIREAQITGAIWVLTTNPFRPAQNRAETFSRNLSRIKSIFAQVPDDFALVRSTAEYRAARAEGKHAAFLGIQGGNALDVDEHALDRIQDGWILRITLVHLTSSSLGVTSSPLKFSPGGLTSAGRAYVKRLNEKKIFLDLAHIDRKGFFDALEEHDKTQPVLVTHTGVTGVHPHWRNLDDEQLRAVANLGGVVGVMYQDNFLGDRSFDGKAESIVKHLEHIRNVAGEDVPSLGSDWDGMIVPPRDMRTCLELPIVVHLMLQRGWKPESIQKALGTNFLNTVARLRG